MIFLENILIILFNAAGIFLLLNVLYLFFFALAGHFKIDSSFPEAGILRKICVLLPAYKEDAVIIDAALHAVAHSYPGQFEVCVIADKLTPATIQTLRENKVTVVEVAFEKSTKGKALLAALNALPANTFEIALVLDADNLMGTDFLNQVNNAFSAGYKVIQGHRTAKNLDTPFALLDSCNEEINNHIFRLGHQNVGLSSALIGSGMAFEYNYLIQLLQGIGDTAGEDKEIDFRILKDKVKIAYLPEAYVYDEKIANAAVFSNQRSRWISTQIEFLKKYFKEGFVQLFKGNIEFFDKVIQTILLPRILLMGTLVLFTLLALIIPFGPSIFFWAAILLVGGISLLISLPKRFYNKNLWQALMRLPIALFSMVLAILKLKKAGKSFIHTPHTAKVDKSVVK